MLWSSPLRRYAYDRPVPCDSAPEEPGLIQGTIQRVDYRRRELRVIAQGRPWRFAVAADCRLWFNGTPAILRCFHSLDPVTVIFRSQDCDYLATIICSWETQENPCRRIM